MNRSKTVSVILGIVLVFSCLLIPNVQTAAEDGPTSLFPLSHFAGATRALAVRDNFAYVGVGGSLVVVDIADRTKPTLRAELQLPNAVEGVAIDGSYAYVAAGPYGMRVINIDNPARPVEVGAYDVRQLTARMGAHYVEGKAEAVAVCAKGKYAYLGFDDGELHVVDVSVPSSPAKIAVIKAKDRINGMSLDGNLLYVAAWTDGLKVVDVSNPAAPTVRGALALPKQAQDVAVSGGYAYIANSGDGLTIADVSNPAAPTFVSKFNPNNAISSGNRVKVLGGRCYVSNQFRGVYWVDITNPTSPTQLGYFAYKGYGYGLDGDARFIYVGDYTYGLDIVDTSNPLSPKAPISVGTISWGGSPVGSCIVGNYAYIAFNKGGVSVYDISVPTAPRLVGNLKVPYGAYDVKVVGKYAYIADSANGLVVADVSNLANMTIVGQYKVTGGTSNTVTVAGNLVYLAVDVMLLTGQALTPAQEAIKGIHVIDVSNPTSPRGVNKLKVMGQPVMVEIVGNRAYIADGYAGVTTYDIGNIERPVLISNVATPPGAEKLKSESGYAYGQEKATFGSVNRLDVEGNIVYGAASDYGVRVFDFTDPTKPKEIGLWEGNDFSYVVTVLGKYAYVNQGHEGLYILDVSTPSKPREVVHYDTPGNSWGIAFGGDTVLIGDGTGGVLLYGRGLDVEMTKAIEGNSATYSVMLRNGGSTNISQVYVAAAVPEGATFDSVVATPPGSYFYNRVGATVSWLSTSVAPGSSLGPFSFKVNLGSQMASASKAWVHWASPAEGSAGASTQ